MSVEASLIGWPSPDDGPLGPGDRPGVGPAWDRAIAAVGLAEQEIERLWKVAIGGEQPTDLQRLADVSHALSRASRLLRDTGTLT